MPTAFRTALNLTVSSGLPVSGAALWLDASQQNSLFTDAGVTPVTTNGQSVYQWNDLSGNGRHAIQATSGSRPTWASPANGQNGLGIVAFSGSGQYMLNNTYGVTFTSATIFLVFKLLSTSNTYARFYTHSAGGTDYNEAGNWLPCYRAGGTTFASATTSNGGPIASITGSYNFQMFRHVHTGTQLQNTINSTTQSSLVSVATLNKSTTLYQLGKTINSTAEWFAGSAAEIIVYRSQLNSTQISITESYLKSKWGTP